MRRYQLTNFFPQGVFKSWGILLFIHSRNNYWIPAVPSTVGLTKEATGNKTSSPWVAYLLREETLNKRLNILYARWLKIQRRIVKWGGAKWRGYSFKELVQECLPEKWCEHRCVFSLTCVQLFWDSMNCSPPGFPVHGILQARMLEQLAISSSRGFFPDPGIEPASLVQVLYHSHHLGSPRSWLFDSNPWKFFLYCWQILHLCFLYSLFLDALLITCWSCRFNSLHCLGILNVFFKSFIFWKIFLILSF